jgi:transcription elongation factor Elf1
VVGLGRAKKGSLEKAFRHDVAARKAMARRALDPPYPCPNCGHKDLILIAKETKFEDNKVVEKAWRGICGNCLEASPLVKGRYIEMIDGYNAVVDAWNKVLGLVYEPEEAKKEEVAAQPIQPPQPTPPQITLEVQQTTLEAPPQKIEEKKEEAKPKEKVPSFEEVILSLISNSPMEFDKLVAEAMKIKVPPSKKKEKIYHMVIRGLIKRGMVYRTNHNSIYITDKGRQFLNWLKTPKQYRVKKKKDWGY